MTYIPIGNQMIQLNTIGNQRQETVILLDISSCSPVEKWQGYLLPLWSVVMKKKEQFNNDDKLFSNSPLDSIVNAFRQAQRTQLVNYLTIIHSTHAQKKNLCERSFFAMKFYDQIFAREGIGGTAHFSLLSLMHGLIKNQLFGMNFANLIFFVHRQMSQ